MTMEKATFVTVAAKLMVNVHDLNNEMSTGNVSDIRIIEYINPSDGKKLEAPAISGRMVKHWHQEILREIAEKENLPLCAVCAAGESVRPGTLKNGALKVEEATSEDKAIEQCVVCDIHGFLVATKRKEKEDKGTSLRRNSRALFSWALPVFGKDFVTKQVTHTRVSEIEKVGGEESQAGQALFYKSYASSALGLVSALDLELIGVAPAKQFKVQNRIERMHAAVEAYRYLLSGRLGASMGHAVPHVDIQDIVIAVGFGIPLAIPPSPIYPDYLEKLVGLIPEGKAKVAGVGLKEASQVPSVIKRYDSVNELFNWVHAQIG